MLLCGPYLPGRRIKPVIDGSHLHHLGFRDVADRKPFIVRVNQKIAAGHFADSDTVLVSGLAEPRPCMGPEQMPQPPVAAWRPVKDNYPNRACCHGDFFFRRLWLKGSKSRLATTGFMALPFEISLRPSPAPIRAYWSASCT